MKFKLKQHVQCTRQGSDIPEIGVIAEVEELNALVEDENGNRYEENTYMVMLHDKNGKMIFEEFLESELIESLTI